MPVRNHARPAPRQGHVGVGMPAEGVDPAVDRAVGEATDAIQRLEGQIRARSVLDKVDLVIGTNRVIHRLGRRPRHCHITPTVTSAAFAYSLTDDTDEKVAVLDVVGADQPACGVIFE